MASLETATSSALERRVLDALPNTVYSVDLDGRITSINQAWGDFARAHGAPQIADDDAVIGRRISDAISDPAAREQISRAFDLLRAGRVPRVTWEFSCDSPDEERLLLMQVSPIHEGHTLTGFLFSTVDITASHQSRQALIDAGIALSRTIALERVFQETAFQVRRLIPGEGVAIGLASGDSASLQLAFVSGFDGDQDKDVGERLRERWQAAIETRLGAIHTAGDGVHELDVPMISGTESVGVLTVRAEQPIGAERVDEALRVLTTIAAQTGAAVERAALIRRIEQKRRLEAIGEMSAGVAHELRNPLFGISSATQLVRFRAKDDPVVEKNVGRILREVEHLNRMVTSLLDLGRPSTTVLIAGDPDAIWDDVLAAERGRIESRSLRLSRKRPKRHARVALDAGQIAQLFINVLANAVEASPDGATISLVTETLVGGAWRCRLRNDGPVMPAEQLSRAFEIFFSTKAGSMGIGLTLCQRIVDEHGGTIALDSTPDTGTTLTIVLPPHR